MSIELVVLIAFIWTAVGFLAAFALGRILRDVSLANGHYQCTHSESSGTVKHLQRHKTRIRRRVRSKLAA